PDTRSVLLLRQGARPRRTANGDSRSGRVPALGWNRLTGGSASDDEARVPGDLHSFPQLSNPLARLAGESERACQPADAVAAPLAALPRGVWRDSAASGPGCSRTDAGHRLSAADDADC